MKKEIKQVKEELADLDAIIRKKNKRDLIIKLTLWWLVFIAAAPIVIALVCLYCNFVWSWFF
jgi:hypothetical protein